MSETASQRLSDLKYTQATLVEQPATPTATSVPSPRQRVVTASHTQESVVLRFTPRTVRQSGADTKTS